MSKLQKLLYSLANIALQEEIKKKLVKIDFLLDKEHSL